MIFNLSKEFLSSYNKFVSKIYPSFDQVEFGNIEEEKLLSISVALRIAAKLARRYGYSKEAFIDAANGNYDLEFQKTNVDYNIN